MKKYMTQSEATRTLAAEQTHDDMHPGHGVITVPTHEEIARLAYDIYIRTGRQPGHCKQNWYQAEKSLHNQDQAARRANSQDHQHHPAPSTITHAAGVQ